MGTIAPGTQGMALSDTPEDGAPVQIGASVDNTSPTSVAEGDVRRIRVSPQGLVLTAALSTTGLADNQSTPRTSQALDDTNNRAVAVGGLLCLAPDGGYDRLRTLGDVAMDGLGQLCTTPAVPGAGVVINNRGGKTNSSARLSFKTPAAGRRIRIISVIMKWNNATAVEAEVYFGTGANIGTISAKSIAEGVFDLTDSPNLVVSWPDGAGPVGDIDEVLSVRVASVVNATFFWLIKHREE